MIDNSFMHYLTSDSNIWLDGISAVGKVGSEISSKILCNYPETNVCENTILPRECGRVYATTIDKNRKIVHMTICYNNGPPESNISSDRRYQYFKDCIDSFKEYLDAWCEIYPDKIARVGIIYKLGFDWMTDEWWELYKAEFESLAERVNKRVRFTYYDPD